MTTVITQEDASAINWYRELTPVEKRTFWACFGGWALDAMDVQIFSFVIPAIIIAFAITNADAGLIGTVTLLTSAFGGWFAGALADRFGRVRTLQITILWFAFWKTKARYEPGKLTGIFLMGYGLARFFVEFFREPDEGLGTLSWGLTMGQTLTVPMLLGGLYLILTAKTRRHRVEPIAGTERVA